MIICHVHHFPLKKRVGILFGFQVVPEVVCTCVRVCMFPLKLKGKVSVFHHLVGNASSAASLLSCAGLSVAGSSWAPHAWQAGRFWQRKWNLVSYYEIYSRPAIAGSGEKLIDSLRQKLYSKKQDVCFQFIPTFVSPTFQGSFCTWFWLFHKAMDPYFFSQSLVSEYKVIEEIYISSAMVKACTFVLFHGAWICCNLWESSFSLNFFFLKRILFHIYKENEHFF